MVIFGSASLFVFEYRVTARQFVLTFVERFEPLPFSCLNVCSTPRRRSSNSRALR